MRILVVGRSDSLHTARWLGQLRGLGWDLHLYPSVDVGITHAAFEDVVVHHSIFAGRPLAERGVRERGLAVPSARAAHWGRRVLSRTRPKYRVEQLGHLIRRLRPDVVHTLQTQHAGYLMACTRAAAPGRQQPPWIQSTWGSDLYFFGRFAEHQRRIRDVMTASDFLITECPRDVQLARQFGFAGSVLDAALPVAGGFDLEHCSTLREPEPVSRRRRVVLKGRLALMGRSLVGLRALERCADLLADYEVVITEPSKPIEMAARLAADRTGLSVRTVPPGSAHESLLREYGRARIALALSISDGVPYSLLEAMVMGAFPVQSFTSCAGEWVEDGRNGALVPPDDPDVVETALRRALTDDDFVEEAAKLNEQLAAARLDHSALRERAIAVYRAAADR